MPLSIGIVGLPNVGKSTLFNVITESGVAAQNYPFCTIDPNTGIVSIPDTRLSVLSDISGSSKLIYATIEFVDIAGLVKGASKGEGLGNKFLSNIRETSAIAHVVRCFEDTDITHVHGDVNPLEDISVINTELLLADFEMAQKMLENQKKKSKSGDAVERAKEVLLEQITEHLSRSNPVRTLSFSDEDKKVLKSIHFLTSKKVIYVANVAESDIAFDNDKVKQVKEFASSQGDEVVVISAKIEEEISQLDVEEKREFLTELGLTQSGLEQLSTASYQLLGLQSYLTTGEKETRAWTIKVGDLAPQAAGVIHTDFEKGFIRANIIGYDEFVRCNGWKVAKEKGLVRQEGKEYLMQDGDVVEFLFNV